MHETAEAIRALVQRGIPLDEIAVLSSHGLSKSKLMSLDQTEDITTRRFTGQFDKNGTPVWIQGAVLVDSIYRFKGQRASGTCERHRRQGCNQNTNARSPCDSYGLAFLELPRKLFNYNYLLVSRVLCRLKFALG